MIALQETAADGIESLDWSGQSEPMLSLIASAGYLVVSALCMIAALSASTKAPKRTVSRAWLGITLLFVLLAANRLFAIEDHMRDVMRAWLTMEGEYQARRTIQGPIAALLLGIGGLAGIFLLLKPRGGPGRAARALAWASRAAAAMIGLVALRLISLHATDALLYAPLRLNWILDIGLTLVVAWSAWIFTRAVGPPEPRRGERRSPR